MHASSLTKHISLLLLFIVARVSYGMVDGMFVMTEGQTVTARVVEGTAILTVESAIPLEELYLTAYMPGMFSMVSAKEDPVNGGVLLPIRVDAQMSTGSEGKVKLAIFTEESSLTSSIADEVEVTVPYVVAQRSRDLGVLSGRQEFTISLTELEAGVKLAIPGASAVGFVVQQYTQSPDGSPLFVDVQSDCGEALSKRKSLQ